MTGSRTAPAPWAYDPLPLHQGTWGVSASVRYCRQLASDHYENFPVALSLMGGERRDALAAVYAFARWADDFADEPWFEGRRDALLDAWEDQLERAFRNDASHPVFVALSQSVRRFDLPVKPFADLIDAFRQDCRKTRYATFDEVLDYCRRSADPVGRIVLRVMGLDSDERVHWSDRICTALQLTNFWQDLSVDLPRGRNYLPMEDMERYGVTEKSLFAGEITDSLDELMRFEVGRTRDIFREGYPLLASSGAIGRVYLTAVWAGGRAILEMVGAQGAGVLRHRPSLSAGGLLRAIVPGGGVPWTR